jgi:hypothetical protein
MKVVGHDTWTVRIPYEEYRAAAHIVLRLNTDDGAQGVSYLTPLVHGPSSRSMRRSMP